MSDPALFTPQSSSGTQGTPSERKPAHVIVTGNEKGGSGKTTATMHLIVGLLRLGFSVGSIDLDARQRSLSRYIENRRQTIGKENLALPLPHHIVIQKSPLQFSQEAEADERERFLKGMSRVYWAHDFVIIDTPGSDTYLSRLAHSFADTVLTPINDSFVDLDVLANVDGQTMKVIRPSIYSEMVWEQKLARAKRDGGSIEWIVMRNRLSNIDARNKRHMTAALAELSRRIGFRVAPGFSERVIFREMFLQGLTVLDIVSKPGNSLSLSHVAARQEVRDLLKMLQNPIIDARISELRVQEKAAEQAPQEQAAAEEVAPEETSRNPEPTPATLGADSALQAEHASTPVAETTNAPVYDSELSGHSAPGNESLEPQLMEAVG